LKAAFDCVRLATDCAEPNGKKILKRRGRGGRPQGARSINGNQSSYKILEVSEESPRQMVRFEVGDGSPVLDMRRQVLRTRWVQPGSVQA
jgi:ribosomal protein L34